MWNTFIDRPVLAISVAFGVCITGICALLAVPVRQYPNIAPTPITVTATYPGADPATLYQTVIQPLEQEMYSLDGVDYISSQALSDGTAQMVVTFSQEINPDIAQVQVQNRLALAEPLLPQTVYNQGISVTKATKNFAIIIALYSRSGKYNTEEIGDYLASKFVQPLTRVSGVGDYTLFGSEFAIRIWLSPEKLTATNLTVADIEEAIRQENTEVTLGELGGLPTNRQQILDASIGGLSRLTSPDEFEQILLKIDETGRRIFLKDVATVTLGSQTYIPEGRYNGRPAAGIGLSLAPGSNQVDVDRAVRNTVVSLSRYLPHDLAIDYAQDTTPYIVLSLKEVVFTLLVSVFLVVFVIYIFLQSARATLIPTISVPVVLLSTFTIISAAGFQINMLTMLAMVLTIGLLVDDAIVVVENVERHMAQGLCPTTATREAMDEIGSALIGVALVLSAVFVPMAFFSGSAGVIYRQFSVVMVSAMLVSVVVALTIIPSLCALLLHKPKENNAKNVLFRGFERFFFHAKRYYIRLVLKSFRNQKGIYASFLIISIAALVLLMTIPGGFMPDEDQEVIYGQIQLPPGASANSTRIVNDDVYSYFSRSEHENVSSIFTAVGFNAGGRAQNLGYVAVHLKDWSDRGSGQSKASDILRRAAKQFRDYPSAKITLYLPPPVMELGNASGFDLELTNKGNLTESEFISARDKLLAILSSDRRLRAIRYNGPPIAPKWSISIDRQKARIYGVADKDLNETLRAVYGEAYINLFTMGGRQKKVFVQGIESARSQPSSLDFWFVRNQYDKMVPLKNVVTSRWVEDLTKREIYNGNAAFEILGTPADGVSTGQAMGIIEGYRDKLPTGVDFEWTGVSFEERKSGGGTAKLYILSICVVLLSLTSLYESWFLPIGVLLSIPLGIFGAAALTSARGFAGDIYFQVGMLTTIGLTLKNSILIAEFAKTLTAQGMPAARAAIIAARERFRPIVMTSLAFILGTLPLALADGAGAGAHRALGTAVVGGMVGATILAPIFVPMLFYIFAEPKQAFRYTAARKQRSED